MNPGIHTWSRPPFIVTTDPAALDLAVIHGYLTRSYWSPGIPREVVERAVCNSLCFGLYHDARQIGFARIVSDRATFAYLADVFVLEQWRGHGLSKFLMECVRNHPDLQQLRRWMLATADAHSLYARYGFTPLSAPERIMEALDRDVYARMTLKPAPGG